MEQEYTGNNCTRRLNQLYLLSNPDELNILADALGNILGLRYTTHHINCHRPHNGFDEVCKSTVNIAFLRLQVRDQEYRKFNSVLRIKVSGKKKDSAKQNNS